MVWRKIKSLVAPLPSILEDANQADKIIAAALIEGLLKETLAVSSDKEGNRASSARPGGKPCHNLVFFKEGKAVATLVLQREGWRKGRSRDGDGIGPWWWHPAGFVSSVTLNGMPFHLSTANWVVRQYERWQAKVAETNRISDQALKSMEQNEAKWGLAEQLLGMKRNEFGALVPVKTAEETCVTPCADCASAETMCETHQYTKASTPKEKTNGTAKKRSGGTPRRILNGEQQGLLSPLPN